MAHSYSKKKASRNSRLFRVSCALFTCLLVALLLFIWVQERSARPQQHPGGDTTLNQPTPTSTATPTATAEPTATPEPPLTFEEITVLSAGDLMFHMPQINGAYDPASGEYRFYDNFQYVKPLIAAADLAVANFETTLADTQYSGFPSFCAPVSTLDAIRDAGFDTLLFANNHCYDRRLSGLLATMDHFEAYGFSYLGATREPGAHNACLLQEVKGIRLGLMNYSDSITEDSDSGHTINGIPIADGDFDYMNLFVRGQEEAFYARVAEDIRYLRDCGADLLIFYIHWGDEYQLTENEGQRQMAQRLCDMGIDVIIGGHPHVIQPMEILTASEDPTHRTVCFYSLGNYISNQNRLTLSTPETKVQTENGLMVTLHIRKYSNGAVLVSQLDYTPTWVHRYQGQDGYYNYNIIPLPATDPEALGLTASWFGVQHAQESFAMTDAVFSEAVASFNQEAMEAVARITG